jgi:predicted MFS family arabinose efflux permease
MRIMPSTDGHSSGSPANIRGRAVRLALGTASALGLARFAYGLLVPAMGRDLGWNLVDAGAVSAANGLGYLLGALGTTAVIRRIGTAAAFRWGMVLTALALAATAVSGDFVVVLIVRAVAGAAGALVFIVGGVIASKLTTRGAIPIYFAGTGLGIVFAGATVPLVGDDWRLAWACIGAAAALAAVVSWTSAGSADGIAAGTGHAHLRSLWPLAVAYLLFAAGYITYITFLSAFLAERHAPLWQVISTWVVLGLAVVAAPGAWSRPLATSPGRALIVLLAILSGASALALVTPNPLVILASALIYGGTFMCIPAAITAIVKGAVTPSNRAATLAIFTVVFAAGQTAGPWIAGMVAEHTSADSTLIWTAILCAAAAVVAWVARRPRPEGRPVDTSELREGPLDAQRLAPPTSDEIRPDNR